MTPSVSVQVASTWRSFGEWRRTRPFWGGLIAIIAGIEMYAITAVPFKLMLVQGPAGISAALICIVFVLLTVLTWLQPQQRLASGLIIVVFSLASILLTNLGGFLIGMLLGLHAGASIASWRPPGAATARRRTPKRPSRPTRRPPTPLPLPPAITHSGAGSATGRTGDTGARTDPGTDSTGRGNGTDDSTPASRRSRRTRRTRRADSLGALMVLATLTSGGLPAQASPASGTAPRVAERTTLPCKWLPWLCPSPNPTPAPKPPGPKPPAPNPSSTSGPSTDPSGSDPDPSQISAADCDVRQVPKGPIRLGTEAAETAASVIGACVRAQKEGSLTVPTKATDSGLPLLGVPATHMVASQQDLSGLSYDGVATVRTAEGTVRTLKFTADSVTLTGMKQDVAQPSARFSLVPGGTAELTGNVSLYVLTQSGKAFGVLPLTLTPDSPPPLVLPAMFFTDVEARIAYIAADSLTVPKTKITVA